METVRGWNRIIENYFNENNIKYDRNYLCVFSEVNMSDLLFEKRMIDRMNKDFKESIIILFNKNEIEIFSCDVTVKISSGMELSNIGKIRKIFPREKIKTLKLVKKITKYRLYFEAENESKIFRVAKFFGFKKSWAAENINYLVENKLIDF